MYIINNMRHKESEQPQIKEKKRGQDYLLQENGRKMYELLQRRQKRRIEETEYLSEKGRLEEERLEILTRPE